MRGVIEQDLGDAKLVTMYGSSDDSKPTTGIADGSVFIETDTLTTYIYDETNETWRELA